MTKLRRGGSWASMVVLDKEWVAWSHRGISRSFDEMKYRLSLNDACTACPVDVKYVFGLRASISKSQGHGLEGGSHKTRGPDRDESRQPSPTRCARYYPYSIYYGLGEVRSRERSAKPWMSKTYSVQCW